MFNDPDKKLRSRHGVLIFLLHLNEIVWILGLTNKNDMQVLNKLMKCFGAVSFLLTYVSRTLGFGCPHLISRHPLLS